MDLALEPSPDRARRRASLSRKEGQWKVNQWLKKVLLSFRAQRHGPEPERPGCKASCFTRCPPSTRTRARTVFAARASVPCPTQSSAAAYRRSPNVHDRADAFVRQCRRVRRRRHHDRHLGDRRIVRGGRSNVHLSGGVGIGGVLEPLQAEPVIIEDNCFIGARSEDRRRRDREGGCWRWASSSAPRPRSSTASRREFHRRSPAGAVVVPGSLPRSP